LNYYHKRKMKTSNTMIPRKTTKSKPVGAKAAATETGSLRVAARASSSSSGFVATKASGTSIRLETTPGSIDTTDAASSSDNGSYGSITGLFRRGISGLWKEQQQGTTSTRSTSASTAPLPQTSPNDPYLHQLPDDLHRYYKPLPKIVQLANALLATWMAVVTTSWKNLPTNHGGLSFSLLRKILGLLLKSATTALIAGVVLQDTLFKNVSRPSRVTTDALAKNYFLPSSLSNYEAVTVDPIDDETEAFSLGVHYLQYDNQGFVEAKEMEANADNNINNNNNNGQSFGAVYCQHGFGASSLSWLPVLPELARNIGARVALGHDAVGFGFTDRPRDKRWFSSRQSSRIAFAILASKISENNNTKNNDNDNRAPEAVCLLGHSMGSRATLRLATQLPPETPRLIILSSPALGLIRPPAPRPPPSTVAAGLVTRAASSFSAALGACLKPVARYGLRRAIGADGTWRKGLAAAWGEPQSLEETGEILRYSWPSVGTGWERGILSFCGAQVLPEQDPFDDDVVLMQAVLGLPNTKVLIVLGEKDRVVPRSSVFSFLEKVRVATAASGAATKTVPVVVELESLGHVAFEEDPKTFCDTVEQLVQEHWDEKGNK